MQPKSQQGNDNFIIICDFGSGFKGFVFYLKNLGLINWKFIESGSGWLWPGLIFGVDKVGVGMGRRRWLVFFFFYMYNMQSYHFTHIEINVGKIIFGSTKGQMNGIHPFVFVLLQNKKFRTIGSTKGKVCVKSDTKGKIWNHGCNSPYYFLSFLVVNLYTMCHVGNLTILEASAGFEQHNIHYD